MTVLAHVAATVAATPLPSPAVTKEVFTNTVKVPEGIPAVVVQATVWVAMFVVAFALSVLHQVAEWLTAKEKGWPSWVNRLLATGYSEAVAVGGLLATGHFNLSLAGLAALLPASGVSLSGSFWTYEWRQFVAGLTGGSSKPVQVNLPDVPLASDSQSAAG